MEPEILATTGPTAPRRAARSWCRAGAALAVAAAAGACSTAATVRTADGSTWQVRVVRSNAEAIYGVPPGGDREVRLARADVVDIDHPGNLHGLVGTVLTGILLVPLIDVMGCERDSCTLWKVAVGGFTLASGTMGAWGWTVWARSRSRAGGRGPDPGPNAADLGPDLGPDPGPNRSTGGPAPGAAGGLSLERRW